jgi:hypothetical protein
MWDCIDATKTILTNNLTINHDAVKNYQDFIAEDYPAICLDPDTIQSNLDNGLSWNYDDAGALVVYYIEEAPEDRDMSAFIQKIDSIVDILKEHPRLNQTLNQGINITSKFMRRGVDDNIEFIAQIKIEGRNM